MSNPGKPPRRIQVIEGVIIFAVLFVFLIVVSFSWGAPISTLCVILAGIIAVGVLRSRRPDIFEALKKKKEGGAERPATVTPGEAAERAGSSQRSYMMLVGLNKGSHYRVFVDKSPFVIGNSASADFQLVDPYVSRQHLSVEYDAEMKQRYVTDTSLNGTVLNGVSLNKGARTPVQQGDTLQLGDALFCVEFVHNKAGN